MENRHHILHNRKEWTLRDESRKLRGQHGLIPAMPIELHKELHEYCPSVPLLGYQALLRTASLYIPSNNTLQAVDNLLIAIDLSADHPKAHAIERSLAEVVIQAIQFQIPFLRENEDYQSIRRIA